MNINQLLSDEEVQILHDFCRLIPIIKNKYFNLGRDMDKFSKLCVKFEMMEKKGDKNGENEETVNK